MNQWLTVAASGGKKEKGEEEKRGGGESENKKIRGLMKETRSWKVGVKPGTKETKQEGIRVTKGGSEKKKGENWGFKQKQHQQ